MPAGTSIKVLMLDDSTNTYDVKPASYGNVLIQAIMKDLDVLESDYFGAALVTDDGLTFLDPLRQINKQIKKISDTTLEFVVKFYSPDPSQLEDEYTRYLLALQVKRDIQNGLLPCAENTAVKMASFIVQAEFGDWNSEECYDTTYLEDLKLMHNPTARHLQLIREQHRKLVGKTPAESDYSLLDIARRLEHYGVRLHPALDAQNMQISLGVCHSGVLVFQDDKKINGFNWARIRKLSFKRKRFMIKLRTESMQKGAAVGDILIFSMRNRDACKDFWRLCIEHHAFFRLEIRPKPKPKPILLSRGSSFHYNGKTQKELLDLVRHSNFRRTNFVRTTSRRRTQNSVSSPTSVIEARKFRPENNFPTQSSNKSNNVTPESSITSPVSSPYTDDQASYTIGDSSQQSPSESDFQSTTQVDVTTEGDQSASTPEWQLESKSLHSSAMPIEDTSGRHEQAPPKDNDKDASTAKPVQTPETAVPKVDLHADAQQAAGPDSGVARVQPTAHSGAPPSINTSTQELKMASVGDSQRHPTDQAYYIAKEFLTSERSYIKDLEVIDRGFKSALEKAASTEDSGHLLPDNIANQLFNTTDSLLTIHKQFKLDLEARMVSWENYALQSEGEELDNQKQYVDDILLAQVQRIKKVYQLIENGEDLVRSIENACSESERFDEVCREFELQKVCYIPITRFLLQPMQRVLHYTMLIERLQQQYYYEGKEAEHDILKSAMEEICNMAATLQPRLEKAHNFQKLAQLRHDLIGVDHLLNSEREFVREGSLYKLSRKGFQQRLFFLFSGCLLYTSKGVTSTNQFKVHGELPLQGMIIEINDSERAVPNCFSILSGPKTVVVAASTHEEMSKWIEDLNRCIILSKDSTFSSPLSAVESRPVSSQSVDQSDDSSSSRNSLEVAANRQNAQQRSNTTMHVCWHRNTSVSSKDYVISLQNQLCGYLLRKFKNSNGWQKLWVVFSNFCLFFYKSHQDDFPLASLPLLGYSVTSPTPADNIQKEYVFKLQFKTHIYFFRAESEYTFSRWLDVIRSATASSKRVRLFSRMESVRA